MRFTTKTEYGLVCLIYMAKHSEMKFDPITIKELVRAEQFSQAYTEKIMQSLRNADIVRAQHGNQGGYSLARGPSQITLKEIVEALEGSTFEIFCAPGVREEIICTHFPMCGVKPVWEKTKGMLDHLYQGITLEMIANNKLGPALSQAS
ncbi:MAG TPA: Rrf2 family transcriptional regulator [Verrucomicrobiae bacterium]|jgi:Rrf2 family protein|nr:Rrf2 family transcriptional regulator [Verrucomicrobiae bacterium]